MKVLINAYACSPDMGSEPGMAWNWCVNLAKYCDLLCVGDAHEEEGTVKPQMRFFQQIETHGVV